MLLLNPLFVAVPYWCVISPEGIRVNLNYLTDVVEARALSYRNDYIHIYSNSWGPLDNGFVVEGPGYYSGKVLKEGAYKVHPDPGLGILGGLEEPLFIRTYVGHNY